MSLDVTAKVLDGKHLSVNAAQHQGKNTHLDHPEQPQPSKPNHQHYNTEPKRLEKQSKSLRGSRFETASMFYLKQIAIDGEETNEDIGQIVKDYASEKGIRIMDYRVIRYRACKDTVGLRMSIPEAQQHIALNPDTWPDEMTCRRWEPNGVHWRKMNHERGYNGFNNSNWHRGEDEEDRSYNRDNDRRYRN